MILDTAFLVREQIPLLNINVERKIRNRQVQILCFVQGYSKSSIHCMAEHLLVLSTLAQIGQFQIEGFSN